MSNCLDQGIQVIRLSDCCCRLPQVEMEDAQISGGGWTWQPVQIARHRCVSLRGKLRDLPNSQQHQLSCRGSGGGRRPVAGMGSNPIAPHRPPYTVSERGSPACAGIDPQCPRGTRPHFARGSPACAGIDRRDGRHDELATLGSPACAGIDRVAAPCTSSRSRHGSPACAGIDLACDVFAIAIEVHGSPACAGIDQTPVGNHGVEWFPRMRGDRPDCHQRVRRTTGFPRMRGDRPANARG